MRDSFVGIAAVQLLPRASTTSKNPTSLPTFSGIMQISTITKADTTLLSHQHRKRISSSSSMSNNICGRRIPPIMNSV